MNSPEKYIALIKQLFPKGRLWTFPEGSTIVKLITGIAQEFTRVADRADDLIREADPRQTTEMLSDWEEAYGLPGDCGPLATTIADRRTQLVNKITNIPSQNKQVFVDIAVSLGYAITLSDVTEYSVFRVGDRVNEALNSDAGWPHTFSVHAPEFTERIFRVGDNAMGDRLREFGDELLECLITDAKPAHSLVFFEYG